MPYNAYMYLRKSRQDDTGESVEETLRRHDETLREFARNNQIHILGVIKRRCRASVRMPAPKFCAARGC